MINDRIVFDKIIDRMKDLSPAKNHSKLKQRFKQLIENLRSKTDFNNKAHLSFKEVFEPIQAEINQHVSDIIPTTLESRNNKDDNNEMNNDSWRLSPHPNQEFVNEKSNKTRKDSQIQIQDNQEDMEMEQNDIESKGIQLLPCQKMQCPFNEGRIGQIKHQNTSVNLHLNSKIAHILPARYSKTDNKRQYTAKVLPVRTKRTVVTIKELDDLLLIKYWNKHKKLTESSTSAEIYRYFEQMMDELAIDVPNPMIQKFKNCVYFGQKKCQSVYQGIIYYFSGKLYYGQFLNAIKHGHGVEINFNNNVKYAGIFNGGSKNGYFFVQKQKENYQGVLQYGLYHGNGKLMTEDWVYTGSFQHGKKHGYGEEIYPKTGLKIQGYFREGQYQNFNEVPKQKAKDIEKQLPSKIERSTLKKCESYDIKVDLSSKLMNRQKSQFIDKRRQSVSMNRSQSEVNEIQFHEDSKSLFDLLQKRNNPSKYDIYLDKIAQKLPKIHIQGLPQKQSRCQEQTIINRRFINNEQQNDSVLSRLKQRHRPIHYSAPKQCSSSNERLAMPKKGGQISLNNR